ncbi:MobA/MobL family protein [Rhodanobacter sp. DHG33]|uniref:MobA/MobL family protein n=1 Tax=Rhodanobacter sp. DHG33 TaxID=2775921 RepID=UPI001787104A|nr:MobA/MobL family protein [Rhodanobacter sp. DHG33]MBD8898576.1 MobA/MobL family protein [Rhodanobacter sp. DHG33]
MKQLHFDIVSKARGTTADHIRYIMRKGEFAERDDFVGWNYGNMPSWAWPDPEAFFLTSDKYERVNSPAFIAVTFSLPNCLSTEQNVRLASKIMDAVARGMPYMFAVHEVTAFQSGVRHPHVHGMLSGRVDDGVDRSPEQTFRRYNNKHPARGGCKKVGCGIRPAEIKNSTIEMRRIIAETINDELYAYGFDDRVDHRPLREQGIAREPVPYMRASEFREMRESQSGCAHNRKHHPEGGAPWMPPEPWSI